MFLIFLYIQYVILRTLLFSFNVNYVNLKMTTFNVKLTANLSLKLESSTVELSP